MTEHSINVPNGHIKPRPETERRAWVRFAIGDEVCCQPLPASTAAETRTGWLGKLRDISPGGLALLLHRFFTPGSLLIVELSDKAERGACSFPVQVVHVSPEGKRRWIIGCEFIRPLSEEELQALRRPRL
jgi:PilZ domain